MTNRIEYFDVLRGLAIIGVVAIHSSGIGLQFNENSINFNFTVPMFLAISGYFLAKKRFNNYKDYFSFLKRQIPRVYIPLFLWSLIWFCLAVFIMNKPILHELINLIAFSSSGPYYFIALIIQFYILLPILNRFVNGRGLILSILISLSMTLVILYFRYYTEISLPLIIYAGNFATWLMFFILGLYIGSSRQIKISNKVLLLLILVFYIISCVETYLLINIFHHSEDAVTAIKASSFMYSFTLIIFLFNNQDLIKSKLLKIFGQMSFGIYLIHMFPLMVASKILSYLPSLKEISSLYQVVLILMVMLSCFLLIFIFNKIFSIEQNKLIGFK